MAIAEMRKLNLVAMSYDKDAILDALQRTGAVEITLHKDAENTVVPTFDAEDLRTRLSSVEAALFSLCREIEAYEKELGISSGVLKDGFSVTYSEFMSAKERREEMETLVSRIQSLMDEKNRLIAERAKVAKEKRVAEIYKTLDTNFNAYHDTARTRIRLGTVASNLVENLQKALQEISLCEIQTLATYEENTLLLVVAHKSVSVEMDGVLASFAFSDCPYKDDRNGVEIYGALCQVEVELSGLAQENAKAIYELKTEIRALKIYSDYLSFAVEKIESGEKMRATQCTFFMQAFVPKEAEACVSEALDGLDKTICYEFFDLTEEDEPPTLLKNNAVVSNFEGITNTYSAPNYREFDPNAVMAFFYSLFMGFIIGDAGYGLLMAIVGGYIWLKNRLRPTGVSRLAGAFSIGGVFAVVWGVLFNSLFGLAILPFTVMPNPQTDMWSLAGISVPSVLIIAMEIGICQLFVGYLCKAWQEWRRGNILDGIFEGGLWAIFSVGVALAIVGFVDEAGLPLLGTVGGITAGVSLLLVILTAGRKEKFFGKFAKGFGAAYSVINYASDILSYARLYGLMLSGAVIAQIIGQYGLQFIASGNIAFLILGVVILIVGHAFNLVMNLLGAYIHDARLQYVEFYGRFFEGDGELFAPLGSNHKYVYLTATDNDATA